MKFKIQNSKIQLFSHSIIQLLRMKTIIRNFLSVIRRYRLATALNVLGLSVAFATFIVIMMQVDYDRNFDRFHRDTENIFRMEVNTQSEWAALTNVPLSEILFASSPHIVAGTIVKEWTDDLFFSVDTTENRSFFKEKNHLVTPGYTAVFPFEMAEGSAQALEEPEKVLIPQSLSARLFNGQSAVGRNLFDKHATYTVGGVYRDFPQNASVPNVIYVPMPDSEKKRGWNYWAHQCYFRLNAAENIDGLLTDLDVPLRNAYESQGISPEGSISDAFRFVALPEVHYTTDVKFDTGPKTTRETVLVLLVTALLVVLVGGINYFNFSNALTPKRMKSINIQKVMGAGNGAVRMALIMESVAICLVSWLIALLLVHWAQYTPVAQLVDGGMALVSHPRPALLCGLLALLTGCATGIYPAYYMTSFSPAWVLKGSFGQSPGGRRFRNLLMSVQFLTSIILIICASFIYLQNHYMQHAPTGYDRDELIVAELNERTSQNQEALGDRLKSFSGTAGVAFADDLFAARDFYSLTGDSYHGRQTLFQHIRVSPSFPEVMGIRVQEGRDFRPDDIRSQGVWIFNRKARDEFELELNDRIDGKEIIGFMPDLKIASFRVMVEPMGLYVKGSDNLGVAYVKVQAGADLRAAMAHVRQTLKEFDPDYPFNVRFFDEVLNSLYGKEQRTGLLITLFSLVAIFISIVGVFGLVVFDSEYRRKEIGIRKVFGATTHEILVTFNKSYIRILVLCFVLSAPIAWYAVSRWLENFAYRTPMYWWIYIAAFAAVFLLTVCTVTFQNWRAANMNPVESVKSE
jgi:putative ABC transport system permease protein